MKNQDEITEEQMVEAFEIEQLEDRLEMAWLGGKVINGETGYEY